MAVQIGEVVLLIGGSRPDNHPESCVVVVDCRTLEVYAAELAPGSITPDPRLRHGACEIAPDPADGHRRVLVLGGVSEEWGEEPRLHDSAHGLMLELLDPGARLVRWHEQRLSGEAPGGGGPLFHHVMCSFAGGTRVVVWGGDTTDFDDPAGLELAWRQCMQRIAAVFVLDVRSWAWQRVETSGAIPGHRSLAAGVVHGDHLVVIGGSSDPKPPRAFWFGELAPMRPHVLNLRTWVWQPPPGDCTSDGRGSDGGPTAPTPPAPTPGAPRSSLPLVRAASSAEPASRTRFAAEKRGNWLVGFGGRGASGEMLSDLFTLNLTTLEWHRPRVEGGSPEPNPLTGLCASSLCAGVIFGGFAGGLVRSKADPVMYQLPQPDRSPATEASSNDQVATTGVQRSS